MRQHVSEIFEETWAEGHEWHGIDWSQDATRIIARTSAAVFVRPELARDPEWQKLTITYTANVFTGVRVLRAWPGFLRPLIHWFLPACKTCRAQVQLARKEIQRELAKREQTRKAALEEGQSPIIYDDTITWMSEDAAGRSVDPAAAQLAFAISALHTTSELLKQTVLDICSHPELIEPLRQEINRAISESGWTIAGLFKMQLLDSVIKESQRLKPGALVNLERKALRDVVMPNGARLARGSNVSVDTSEMWNAEGYERPEIYDGFRFQRKRQARGKGSNTAQLASAEHIAFGTGKAICPGRFFVANEVKVVLASMLLKYETRLRDEMAAKVVHLGFEMLSDPTAVVEIRRRGK